MLITAAQLAALAAAATTTVAGIAITAIGTADDGDRIIDTGLAITIVGVLCISMCALWHALTSRLTPHSEMRNHWINIGHGRGYWEGRRVGKPVVVPAFCQNCGHPIYGDHDEEEAG